MGLTGREGGALSAAVLVTLLVYAPARRAGFVYDDIWTIVRNPSIRSVSPRRFFLDPRTVAAPESGLTDDIYRPLVTLSFAVDYRLWHRNPLPRHLENLLLHLLNGLLVWMLLRRSFDAWGPAWLGTLVFLLHPVQVQTVAWITQRSGLMCTFGLLVAWNCLAGSAVPSAARSLAAFLGLGFALFSKEIAVVFPAIVFLAEILGVGGFGQKDGRRRRALVLAGMILMGAAYLVLRHSMLRHWSQFPDAPRWMWENLRLGLMGFAVYAGKLLAPLRLRASYDYPLLEPVRELTAWVGAGLYGFIFWKACRRKAWTFVLGMGWIVIGLLPVLQIIPIRAFVAERFLYLPVVGLALAAAWVWECSKFWRVVLLGWVAALTFQTFLTVPSWVSEQTLWAASVKAEPANAFAHLCLAQCTPDPQRAEPELKRVLILRATPEIRQAAAMDLSLLSRWRGESRKAALWAEAAESFGKDQPWPKH